MLIPEQPDHENIQPALAALELGMVAVSSVASPERFGVFWTDQLVRHAQALQEDGLELFVLCVSCDLVWWGKVET